MKRLLCGAIVLLAVAGAYHLGADTASSDYIDHYSTGVVAATSTTGDPLALDENGIVWKVDLSRNWVESSVNPLPVPVSQLKFWDETIVVTTDNTLWRYLHGWQDCGQWPGGASATEQATWSAIKARYKEPSN